MRAIFSLSVFGVVLVAGCQQVAPTTEAEGARFYAENCVSCHGTPAEGPRLAEAPDLTRISARNGGQFPRDAVMSTIDGYTRGDHGNGIMPEFGAEGLGELEIVAREDGNGTPVPRKLLALADYLETIQRN